LIWIKRIIPFVIIGAVWWGFHFYHQYQTTHQIQLEQKYAQITAQIWVASAQYRKEPERFKAFRDSLLKKNNLSKEQLKQFIEKYKKEPEKLSRFSVNLNLQIDSLVMVEDSLLKLREVKDSLSQVNPDSLLTSDSLMGKLRKHSDSIPIAHQEK